MPLKTKKIPHLRKTLNRKPKKPETERKPYHWSQEESLARKTSHHHTHKQSKSPQNPKPITKVSGIAEVTWWEAWPPWYRGACRSRSGSPSTWPREHGEHGRASGSSGACEDKAILDELADVLPAVGHGDFIDLIGVQPHLALAALEHAGGQALLQLEGHHGCCGSGGAGVVAMARGGSKSYNSKEEVPYALAAPLEPSLSSWPHHGCPAGGDGST
jgi:hypothetical protein